MTKTIEYTGRGIKLLPHIVDDLTRREFLIGAGLIALAPGCGRDDGDERSGETRTVEHALGTTEVPVDPRRVLVLHPTVVETALVLGVEPVGVSENDMDALGEIIPDGTESVGRVKELNLEAVAALEPDLIIGIDLNLEENYDRLSQIAPTVGVFFGNSTGEWKQTSRRVAETLGRDEEFEDELAEYEQRATEIGRRLGVPDDAPTVAIMQTFEGDIRYELPSIFSGSVLYRDVGLPLPEGLKEPAEAGESILSISKEEIGRGDAEVLFVYSDNYEVQDEEVEELREDPLFQTLQAAESGNVYAVRGEHWFAGGIISANLILDDLEKHMLDGGRTAG